MSETLPPITLTQGTILSDEVYTCIGSAILDGRLRPGQRLRDVDLATQLGVSRTPVREALQRLERFGLVEVAVGRYTRVSEPSDALRHDTAEFTVYFVGNALRIALGSCDEESLSVILGAADAAVVAAEARDGMGLYEAMATLSRRVVLASGNSVFIGVVREAALAIQRNLRGWDAFLDVPLSQAEAFAQLRDEISRRDGDAAERTLRRIHGLV